MTRDFADRLIDERLMDSLSQFLYTMTGNRMPRSSLRHTYEVGNIGRSNKKIGKCKLYRSMSGNTVVGCGVGNLYIRHDGITISGLKIGVVDDV